MFTYIKIHIYYILQQILNNFPSTHNSKLYNHLDTILTNFFHYNYTPTLIYYHQFQELP